MSFAQRVRAKALDQANALKIPLAERTQAKPVDINQAVDGRLLDKPAERKTA